MEMPICTVVLVQAVNNALDGMDSPEAQNSAKGNHSGGIGTSFLQHPLSPAGVLCAPTTAKKACVGAIHLI